ncbi:universal stress protein [Marinobacterium mangrovicola]|uniref:Nucleotide-binding universal stress UspA family protein n=1 Tax=Marinobacterium mangrovicola TaxID=1476959 RepID=A0A4R1GKV7_9GAMM|nr:universal stress protein [Marinobacterium mangrovicola]TCK08758.1 nucleotide-binding universal stress UspA family protein [Marinobacterium mangrovicola]
MREFKSLLYIAHGTADESEALHQALSLAQRNQASLKLLVVCPEFPADFPEYKRKYEESLLEQVEQSIKATETLLSLDPGGLEISIEILSDNLPSIQIIQRVMRDAHDLVIKEAEARDMEGGFKAIDMDLLGKCPVPVWLCRPIRKEANPVRVAVAIDPESEEESAEVLSIRMLQLSHSLAESFAVELHIVSCWDYMLEDYLRHNVWFNVPDTQLTETVVHAKNEHRLKLNQLIEQSGIKGAHKIHHLRGKASDLLPDFVKDNRIHLLVMGTVARTGIPGFLIGNTAENIVQKLSCSLMALKPNGFDSPVKSD